MKHSKIVIFIFIFPALFLFGIVYIYPIIRTFFMSFFYIKTITTNVHLWEFVGLENFRKLLASTLFVQSMKNIFSIWLWGGIAVFFFSILFSMILTSGIKGKSFFRTVIYLPNVVSAVAMATMWLQYAFNHNFGLFHTVFTILGFNKLAAFMWTSQEHILLALIMAYSFGAVGYYLLIFMAGIERVPETYYEAATLEGANIFKKFYYITLPLLRGVFRYSVIMWSVSIIGFFVWTQMFTPQVPAMGTVTPMVYMYNMVFGREIASADPRLLNAGAGAAVGVILTIMTLVVFSIINLFIREEKLEY